MKRKTLPQGMNIIPVGIALIFIGFLVVIVGILLQSFSNQPEGTKFSFVGFIGPFPFGFGNDKQWLMTTLIFAIILFLLVMWLFRSMR
jgi:uncharacterized protein (TIGR00304 family)